MSEKKVKALTDEEENSIDQKSKGFIQTQQFKEELNKEPELTFEKELDNTRDKYDKSRERRQDLYNAIIRQTGTKPPFKANVEEDKEFNNNPASYDYGKLNNPNKHFYFQENKPGIDSNVSKKTFNQAIDAHLNGSYDTAQAIAKYLKDNKQFTKDNGEIEARIKDSQKVATSQKKLEDHRIDNFSKVSQDPKYLTKTLSTTQRAKEHLKNNYDNLVRLIEARKKRIN